MKSIRALTLSIGCLLCVACGDRGAQQVAAPLSHYQPSVSFQDLMDSVVDPAADAVWNAVATTTDFQGMHETRPQTDEDWHELRRRAVVLAEAANLVTVPGRRVADSDKTIEDGEALDVAKIQQRLDSRGEELAGFAGALRDISLQIVDAADKHDVNAIESLGGTLDQVCESCHQVFWYPEDAKK